MFGGIESVVFRVLYLYSIFLILPLYTFGIDTLSADTLYKLNSVRSFVHQAAIELRPGRILPNIPFYTGLNYQQKPIRNAFSTHLKYAFRFPGGSLGDKIYPNTYQGIGLSFYNFGNEPELGNPKSIYLFQRSEITTLSDHVALDYAWNFGLSTGWIPHHFIENPYNVAIGSKTNAYLNAGFYLRWRLATQTHLTTGLDFTHFSNGNTNFPNAGLNMLGLKFGVSHDLRRRETIRKPVVSSNSLSRYPRHINYDLVIFGSSRRKGIDFMDQPVASPHKYPVIGIYFAPMYNWSYRFRAGISVDAVYDGSANVYTEDYIVGTDQRFFKPPINHQIALGMSIRAEYIMPIFTIGVGLGSNLLHKGTDFRGTYQTFVLKVATTRSSFLHIGYNLKDFHKPNHLMLGLGYRFKNKAPSLLY